MATVVFVLGLEGSIIAGGEGEDFFHSDALSEGDLVDGLALIIPEEGGGFNVQQVLRHFTLLLLKHTVSHRGEGFGGLGGDGDGKGAAVLGAEVGDCRLASTTSALDCEPIPLTA